jgi:DNA-binding MarR family transcriptional regulator
MSVQHLAPSELRYLLLALSKEWERAVLEHAHTRDLTSAQVEILLVLNESGPHSMQELGQMLLLNRDPFRSVDSLVAKGLVERGSGEDKRKVLWSLTAEGTTAAASIVATDFSLLRSFISDIPVKSTSTMVSLLRELQSKVAPSGVLEERFGAQQSPIPDLLSAQSPAEIQKNRSTVVAARLRQVIDIKDSGDARTAYEKYGPLLAQRDVKLTYRAWLSLLDQGGPVSHHVLAHLSEVLTGNAAYLLTDDEKVLREIDNHMRAENALLLAGVTGFGGRGPLDAGALQALAELVQKRLNASEKD